MEKKKNSKIKEYWNEKGKSLCFKILHIVCYVLSLGFIILCVYACANTNNKDNKQENVNKGLYKQNHNNLGLVYTGSEIDTYYLSLQVGDTDWLCYYCSYLINNNGEPLTSYIGENYTLFSLDTYDDVESGLIFNKACIYDAPNNSFKLVLACSSSSDNVVHNLGYIYYNVISSGNPDVSLGSFDVSLSTLDFNKLLSFLSDYELLISNDLLDNDSYDIYQFYLNYDVSGIFGGVTDSMTDFIDTIGNGLESSVEIFYDEDNSQLTAIGWLSVIVVAVGLTWSVFSIVSGLIRLRG